MKVIFLVIIIVILTILIIFLINDNKNSIYKIHKFNPVVNRLMYAYSFNLLSNKECDFIINSAEKYEWTQKRHKYYPTIDQEVKNIKEIKFLYNKIEKRLFPFIKQHYNFNEIKINDFFIVKYDLTNEGMDKLDIHRDTSLINFIVSLNNPNEYEGGGTYYPEFNKTITLKKGSLFLNTGKLKHGGKQITKGVRYILIGFIDINDQCINNKYLDSISYKLETPDLDVMQNIFYKTVNIYIINLPERVDRKNYLTKLIKEVNYPEDFKINVQIINADKGNTGTIYKKWKITKNLEKYSKYSEGVKNYWKRQIKKPEKGCFNSHMKIINLINNQNNDENTYNLILEDDADFESNFFFKLKNIINELTINDLNWDICFLGRNALDNENRSLSTNIEYANYSYNAHCYIISNKACKKISNINIKNKIIPYDEFLSALSWSHPRENLNKLYLNKNQKLSIYASKEKLSKQKYFGYSDIN
jgi:GR25 family glycosyltransferase involved in LPS biosynthesis